MKNEITAIKSRLGSISAKKLGEFSLATQKLLQHDLPNLLSEIEAAREVIKAVRFDEQRLSWFVHERLYHYDTYMNN